MSTRSSARNLFTPLDNPELTIRRRSRVDPTLLNDFEMAVDGNDDPLVPDLRTMKELCEPTLNGQGGPITPIAIQATNFGLKNNMIQQVQNSCQFHGLLGDAANKHLDKFLHVTESIKVNGVTDDALRLYLFPYSLTHHATAWFDHLPRNSINTFEEMAKMFLGKYFPPSMVTKLRNEITNFRQRPDESLFKACYITSSSDPKIVALKAKMAKINKNLLKVLQINQQVKAVTHDCETYGGPHSYNDCPTTVGQTQNVYDAGAYNQGVVELVEALVSAPKPNLKPSIPYPSRLHDQKLRDKANDQKDKFFKIFQDLNFNISYVDALILMPKFGPTIKSLMTNRDKLFELARTPLNEHCSVVLLKKLPEKLGDPRKFIISCDFSGMDECLALADLHARINLMPLSVWNKLSLPELSPTCMTLKLADRSISRPVRVAEDVFVKVGTFHFLADFVVVDFDADPRVPLILGRSFLKTERALIDVYKGELTLHVGKEAVTFNLDQTSRYSTNYDAMSINRIDLIDVACEEYSQEVRGFFVSGNSTPSTEPIISTSSPTLTPFGNSDFLLEETDAFLAIDDEPISSEIDKAYYDSEGYILLLEEFLMMIHHHHLSLHKSSNQEAIDILKACHNGPTEGHHGLNCTAKKGKISQRNEMPKIPSKFAKLLTFEASISWGRSRLHEGTSQNRASWSDKLDDARRAFRTTFKTPIRCTPYKLVYEKACHLPIELEHKAYLALKHCNYDLLTVGDHRKVQLNELNELRDQAYENSLIYKEKTKRLHDSKIKDCVFNVGDRVLLFNSRLKIFSGKLKTRWSGPFTITKCGNSLNDFFCHHCTYEFCGNGAHVGYNCPAQVPSFQTLPSFPQQYPCCEDCGVLSEADHCLPQQYTINHPIFNAHNDFLDSKNKIIIAQTKIMEQMTQLTSMCEMACQIIQKKQEEKQIEEEQAANARYWKIPACCDDDDDYNYAITPNEPVDSLSMGDEHLDTISAMESNEFIKSSVENLVLNPSESEGENGCDVPACFITFSNVLFDAEYEFDSIDDQSCSDEDIDSLLDEFTGELTLLKSILSGIDETDCYHENEIRLTKKLLYDNSSPRPPEEFVFENSNTEIESFSPSPIPNEDSDSHMEEIDLSFNPNGPMPPSIEEDDYDSERDILILNELPSNYSLSLPKMSHFILIFLCSLVLLQNHQMEKFPDLLSHRSLKILQPSAKCPMMIHEKNIPFLDVPLFHFYPLDQLKYGRNWIKLSDLKQALRGRHPMLIRSLVFSNE
uniref:Reverse transcriptase domain-containing protein n=1 Tax=Tanacetum cinerariifolium TaxID=118510 RepID=A0A6L2LDI9_TANCI|nr:reverse transcriptase domain-containing protein [Tanacetum cinerariifolium]